MASQPIPRLTEADYLAIEAKAEFKSEFFQGEMFAMSGASPDHDRIQGDFLTELNVRLAQGQCEVFTSDTRVRVGATGLYTYPDISIVCGSAHFLNPVTGTLLNPVVVVEVLSPSTEAYDRGAKFHRYQALSSIAEYVLVSQDMPLVEVFSRNADETWTLHPYSGLSDSCRIESLGIEVPLARIYRRVQFPASPHTGN
ncbi:MAG: Uma2 family endonuclease [Bryobacteraceae bacterium]